MNEQFIYDGKAELKREVISQLVNLPKDADWDDLMYMLSEGFGFYLFDLVKLRDLSFPAVGIF